MNCPNCGAPNPETQKFCGECGTQLAHVCSNCGTRNPSAQKFCGECGTPLGVAPAVDKRVATSSTPLPPTASAERRLVSVLFVDLVGFTSLSESRDSEDVRELLSRYFEIGRALITRYGGTVEKFIGDALMAVWGTPVAQEDDAERAVRAALEVISAVAVLGEERGVSSLRARAGVVTGEAAVTIGAEGEGMVAGDIVNTASRIQSIASPGAVYVGEATKRATEAAIVYEDAGLHELKGKSGLIPLWRAVRVVAGARGALKSAGLEAPFVGRDRELRLVKDLFHACADENKARLVSVVGVPGIGKSRLMWEFFKYFDGLPQTTWWHRGRCLAYGEGVTYWALAEMVRMRARIAEGEDPASASAKLRRSVEEYVPDADERKWVEPRLAQLLGLEERTVTEREELFSAWRVFFERLAEQNTCVMAFEDVQWADAAMLDFIDYLLEWSRNYPIFVMTLARPELLEKRPSWGASQRNATSLNLEPLSDRAMEELLTGLVPGLPDELRAKIEERAAGVPLYAVETVRMLLDRGLLVQEGAVYRPTGTIEALEVPETLHALVAARLDGLGTDERRVVQNASMLGKTFTKEALAAVGGETVARVEPLLSALVRKEIFSIQADPRSPERGQYGFLQDVVKRVAYETLSRRDRKTKHLAAARHLEEAWGSEADEIIEVLAAHYLEAYRLAPEDEDGGMIRGRARELLVAAAERAASLAATREAQRYFEQAIDLATDSLTEATLQERAGQMAWRGGRTDDARSRYERAIELYESAGDHHAAARVSAAIGEVAYVDGHMDEGAEQMERAFETLRSDEPDADLAILAHQLARLRLLMGQQPKAAELLEIALEVAETLRLPALLSEALNTKGAIAVWRGRHEEGYALLSHALRVALEHDLPTPALRAYNNVAWQLTNQDRHREAVETTAEAAELARKVGIRPWEWGLVAGSIPSLIFLGRWDDALERFYEVRDSAAAIAPLSGDLLAVGAVFVRRGRIDDARSLLAEHVEAQRSDDVQLRAAYATANAIVLRADREVSAALEAAERVIAAADELSITHVVVKDGVVEALEAAADLKHVTKLNELLGMIGRLRPAELTPYVQAQGARFTSRLGLLTGELDGVESGFRTAANLLRELGARFWLAVVLLEQGEWLAANGRRKDADPLLEESRAIFEELQARPWLERLAAAESAAVEAVG